MPRYIAFLRAVNVGGRNVVPMSELKRQFERLGLDDVQTFIASGNVIFSSADRSAAGIERRIERALEDALGHEVSTFVRTDDEVAAIARYQPFPESELRKAAALNVGFVAAPLRPAARRALDALTSDLDLFHVRGREIYWMCRERQSRSKFSNAVLERALTLRSTFRGMNTLVRLAEKLRGPAGRVGARAGSG